MEERERESVLGSGGGVGVRGQNETVGGCIIYLCCSKDREGVARRRKVKKEKQTGRVKPQGSVVISALNAERLFQPPVTCTAICQWSEATESNC